MSSGRFYRRRGFWVVVAAVGMAVLVSGESVRTYFTRRRELARLDLRAEETRRRLSGLEARVARAENDDAFLETAARRELGLLGPGEIEFRFVDRGTDEKVEVK